MFGVAVQILADCEVLYSGETQVTPVILSILYPDKRWGRGISKKRRENRYVEALAVSLLIYL